jgi:RNA polymerase sigma-70 factor, ECF subfamily
LATRDTNEADDLIQLVSGVLWQRFQEYDRGRPFLPWAIGFARVEVLRWRQQRGRTAVQLLSEEALDSVADAAARLDDEPDDRAAFLAECVGLLPGKVRQLLELRYGAAMPIQGIADRLGRQVGAIEMALVRARRAVRECVERKLKNSEKRRAT